jgi:hypothetical protein
MVSAHIVPHAAKVITEHSEIRNVQLQIMTEALTFGLYRMRKGVADGEHQTTQLAGTARQAIVGR